MDATQHRDHDTALLHLGRRPGDLSDGPQRAAGRPDAGRAESERRRGASRAGGRTRRSVGIVGALIVALTAPNTLASGASRAGTARRSGDGLRGVDLPSSERQPGTLAIVRSGPQGRVSSATATELTWLFDRPMVVLGAGGATGSGASTANVDVVVDPPLPGALRWASPRLLVLTPTSAVEPATRHRVTLRSARALDGTELVAPQAFTVETAGPSCAVLTEPTWTNGAAKPELSIECALPVAPEDLVAKVSLTHRSVTRPLPTPSMDEQRVMRADDPTGTDQMLGALVRLAQPSALLGTTRFATATSMPCPKNTDTAPSTRSCFRLQADVAFPDDARTEIRIASGLRAVSPEGTSVATVLGDAASLGEYATAETPILSPVSCGQDCAPGTWIGLTPVSYDPVALDGKLHVRDLSDPSKTRTFVLPPPRLAAAREKIAGQANSLEWYTFLPGHRYEVRIDAGTKTLPAGRPVVGAALRQFGFGRQPAGIDLATGEVVIARDGAPEIAVQTRNVRALRIARRTVPRRELVAAIRAFGLGSAEWKRLPATTMRIDAAADATVSTPLRLATSTSTPSTGIEIIAVRATAWTPRSVYASEPDDAWRAALVQVTDLAVQLKESPSNTLISVTSISTGAPVAGAVVELHGDPVSTEGKAPQFWSGRTDKSGFAWAPPRPTRLCTSCRTIAIVTAGDDLAYAHASWSVPLAKARAGFSSYEYDGGGDDNAADADGDGSVTRVERAAYDAARRYGALTDRGGDPVRLVMWADRGIVKPGEQVRVAGVLRAVSPTSLELPELRALPVRVRDARNGIVLEQDLPIDKDGRVELDLTVPETAPLGPFTIQAAGTIASFEVAEFRTPRFEASITATPAEIVPGESATFTSKGRYLFGAPMSDATASWSVRLVPTYVDPFTFEGGVRPPSGREPSNAWTWTYQCSIGRECPTGSPEWESREDTPLGATGEATLTEEVQTRETAGVPLAMIAETVVRDVDRQVQAAQTSVLVHQAQWYAGIRTPQRAVPVGDPIRADVAAVTTGGRWADGRDAEVTLVRWVSSAADRVAQNEEVDRVGTWTETVVTTTKLRTTDGISAVRFDAQPIGTYEIRVIGTDDLGNHVEASTIVDVAPRAEAGPSVAAKAFDPCADPSATPAVGDCDEVAQISLVLDRDEYQPGDTARILIRSPFSTASGVVTVERAEVERAERFRIVGSRGVLEIPIEADDVPGFRVAITLHRPEVLGDDRVPADSQLGRLRVTRASIDVAVPVAAARLDVGIATRAEYRPGDTAAFDLRVALPPTSAPGSATSTASTTGTPTGPPATDAVVTLWAVDDAVVNLTGYRPPDLVQEMYPAIDPLVETSDNEADLVVAGIFTGGKDARAAAYPLKRRKAGGGGGEETGSLRTDLRAVAFWKGRVALGPDGTGRIEAKLPENLTRFRVFAVATSGAGRFGTADTTFRVARPFILSPALPRFLTPGDEVEFAAVVQNPGAVSGDATVRLTLVGGAARATGAVERTVRLAPGQSAEVRFPVRALAQGPLPVELRGRFVRSIGSPLEDGVGLTIPVVLTQRSVTTATTGVLAPGEDEQVPLSVGDAADPNRGGLEVASSATRLAGLQVGVSELLDYPFGCLEQTTSRMRALLYLGDLRGSFALTDLPSAADLRRRTEAELAGLTRFEVADGGGLTYWPAETFDEFAEPDQFLSARTLLLLEDAEELGLRIPVALRDRLVAYLQSATQSSLEAGLYDPDDLPADQRDVRWWSRVETLAALARAGRPERALALAIAEDRTSLPTLERVSLVRALAEGPATTTGSTGPTVTLPTDSTAGSTAGAEGDAQGSGDAKKVRTPTPAELDRTARTMAGMVMAELLRQVQTDGDRASLGAGDTSGPLTYLVNDGVHDSAALLSTLVRIDARHPLVTPLAAGILAARRNGAWGNTIENGYALGALVDAERLAGTDGRGATRLDVSLDEERFGTVSVTARSLRTESVSVPLDVLRDALGATDAGDLSLRNRGDAPAYWSARLTMVPEVRTLKALDSGFSVRRSYRVRSGDDADGGQGVTTFAAGNLVEVELLVTTGTDRTQVAIDDALPAGFEIVDASLGGASAAEASSGTEVGVGTSDAPQSLVPDYVEQRDRAARFFTSYLRAGTTRVTYLVRATSVGRFTAAPTVVEEMYRPEVSGRTATTEIVIR